MPGPPSADARPAEFCADEQDELMVYFLRATAAAKATPAPATPAPKAKAKAKPAAKATPAPKAKAKAKPAARTAWIQPFLPGPDEDTPFPDPGTFKASLRLMKDGGASTVHRPPSSGAATGDTWGEFNWSDAEDVAPGEEEVWTEVPPEQVARGFKLVNDLVHVLGEHKARDEAAQAAGDANPASLADLTGWAPASGTPVLAIGLPPPGLSPVITRQNMKNFHLVKHAVEQDNMALLKMVDKRYLLHWYIITNEFPSVSRENVCELLLLIKNNCACMRELAKMQFKYSGAWHNLSQLASAVQSGALARACRQIDLERYLEERRLLGGYLDRC
jgi:hypothetical protein